MEQGIETLTPESLTEASLPAIGDAELEKALQAGTEKNPEVKAKETPVVKAEEKPAPVKQTPAQEPVVKATPDDEIASLKKQIEQLNKRLTDKEIFIQKQGTEIGELRKARQFYEEQIKIAQEKFDELINTDPRQAMNAYSYTQQAQHAIDQIDAAEFIRQNAGFINQLYPDYESLVEEVAKYGEQIGVPKEFVENYRKNPYATPVQTLIPYVEGAKLARKYAGKDRLLETLKKQVAELDAMTNEETVTTKIAAASKRTPAITARVSDGNTKKPTDGFNSKNIANLSYAELEEMLKQSIQEE